MEVSLCKLTGKKIKITGIKNSRTGNLRANRRWRLDGDAVSALISRKLPKLKVEPAPRRPDDLMRALSFMKVRTTRRCPCCCRGSAASVTCALSSLSDQIPSFVGTRQPDHCAGLGDSATTSKADKALGTHRKQLESNVDVDRTTVFDSLGTNPALRA